MQDKVIKVRQAIDHVLDILSRPAPFGYVASDLEAWRQGEAKQARYLLDELYNDLDPEAPDQQRVLNLEIDQSIEGGTNP